jgi:ribosomal protein S18 acetylase RimI-like enzyme
MTIEIRESRTDEHAQAGAVTADAYREFAREDDPDWQEYLVRLADVADRSSRTTILVAVESDRILGTATLELDGRTELEGDPLRPDEAHIRMLGVAPDARGRGIGRMIMDACEERASASGRTLITLNTTLLMRSAQRMYESMGYSRDEDRVFPDGFVLLSYSKRLV